MEAMAKDPENNLQSNHHEHDEQNIEVPLATLADMDDDPRHRMQEQKRPCIGQKGALVIATTAVFAAVILSVALSSSLKKPTQMMPGGTQNQIFIEPFKDSAAASEDSSDYYTTENEDAAETGLLHDFEESYYPANDGVIPINQDDEGDVEKTSEEVLENPDEFENPESYNNYMSSQNKNNKTLPEDCHNGGCEDESEPSIFHGDISDFVDMTNITRSSSNNRCGANEGECIFNLLTDDYPWELSWKIVRVKNSKQFASGPPSNRNYARKTKYFGSFCLPTGRYYLQMNDMMGDGICCSYGRGSVNLMVNRKQVVQTGSENYEVKRYSFTVSSGTSGGNNGNNNNNPVINKGKECSVKMPIDYNKKFQHGTNYQGFPGWQCYRTVEGTGRTVNDLLAKYPQLASKVTLSYPTAELGIRLYALVVTNKQVNSNNGKKGKMLAISSIHARELTPAETTNPDGRVHLENSSSETRPLWRKNRNKGNCDSSRFGVDNARNFPFKWGLCDYDGSQKCSGSGNCGSDNYRGPDESSEQETKAIVKYATSLFPESQRKGSLQQSETRLDTAFAESRTEGIFLDIHSHGRDIGWPWGFMNKRSSNDDALGALGRKLASFAGYSLWAPQLPNRLYGFEGGPIDTMYGWLGAASYFFELGTSFYQPCDTFPTVINEVFPALLYAAKVAKNPYTAPRGPDILCTTISSTKMSSGNSINVIIEVSDNARIEHLDDGGSLFSTGRQNVRLVEVFVNCHPYDSTCQPTVKKNLPNAGRTATVSLQFKAPVGRTNNVMYIRARDSSQYTGPITARSFVG
ncbi:hypothetical protein ACHAXR_011518 [Thalassiosira sp. AJA248-18]